MSIFTDIFGSNQSSSKSATNQTQTQNQNTNTNVVNNQTTNQGTKAASNTSTANKTDVSQNVAGTGVVSTLSPEAQATLLQLLPQLGANAGAAASGNGPNNSGALQQIAGLFTQKAQNDPAVLQQTIQSAQNKAQLDFQTGEGQQANVIAQAIGSKGNTFSAAVDAKAHNDLITELTNIAAQATLQSQQQSSADLTGAASALGTASSAGAVDATSALAPLLQLVTALKGATTTSATGESTTGSTTQAGSQNTQSIEDILSQILGTTGTNTTQSGTVSADASTVSSGKSPTQGILATIGQFIGNVSK